MTLKLIHLSDSHIVAAPATLYGLDPRARLRAAVEHVTVNHGDAGHCVMTGDLAHWGEPAAYDAFAAILSGLSLPFTLLIGNHDDRAAFRDRFPGTRCDDHGFIQSTLSLDGHTLVFLDTKGDRDHSGAYCGRRLAWLDNILRTKRGPILLFMHHPPFMVGISSIDAIGLADREAFAECVRPHAHRIRHLFLGHVHRPIAGSWLGIPFSVVKGTNHQVALRLDDHGHEIPGSHEPPAYAVALVSDERVVVHTCDFGDRSPRFPLDAHEAGGRAYALDMQFA